MGGKPAVARTQKLERVGSVINQYSNYLLVVVMDSSVASSWGGCGDDPEALDDARRAFLAAETGECEVIVGSGRGFAVELGGCGASDVYRTGTTLVMVEHYSGDSDADIEADFHASIVGTPTVGARLLGEVNVESGVLALVHSGEAVGELSRADLKRVVTAGSANREFGCLVAIPSGPYEIWCEQFEDDVEGEWGVISSRVRIVPKDTVVRDGEPLAPPPPLKKRARQMPGGSRRIIEEWSAISSFAVGDDGRAYAGETGDYRVCGWSEDGKLAWQRRLAQAGSASRYGYEVGIELAGDKLVAHMGADSKLYFLDPESGEVTEKRPIPETRTFAISRDHKHIVLRTGIKTTLLTFPGLKPVATFDDYCNQNCIAMEESGSLFAVNGSDVHVYDLRRQKLVCSFRPPKSPWATCFTPLGALATGDVDAVVRLYDPMTGKVLAESDAAPERSRKPTITCLAAGGSKLAVGREDGTVLVLDASTLKTIGVFEKHNTEIPDTGARTLPQIAFTGKDKMLWVGAGRKKQPIGLTSYSL